MTPAARMTSLADTDFSRPPSNDEFDELLPLELVPGESPAAMLPRIHMACSYTSLLGLDSKEMSVGIASACLNKRCCEEAESC